MPTTTLSNHGAKQPIWLVIPTQRDDGKALEPERREADAAFIRSRIVRQFAKRNMSTPKWVGRLYKLPR